MDKSYLVLYFHLKTSCPVAITIATELTLSIMISLYNNKMSINESSSTLTRLTQWYNPSGQSWWCPPENSALFSGRKPHDEANQVDRRCSIWSTIAKDPT